MLKPAGGPNKQSHSRWLALVVFGVLGAAVGEAATAEPTACIDASDCQMGETCEDTPGGDQVDAHGICVKRCSWPELRLESAGTEEYSVEGQDFRRYKLAITNWRLLPEYLFETAPDLEPCGQNPNAARSWVSIYDATTDTRLYRFCGLPSTEVLGGSLWFGLPIDDPAPGAVHVRIDDRRNGLFYCSNDVPIEQ